VKIQKYFDNWPDNKNAFDETTNVNNTG